MSVQERQNGVGKYYLWAGGGILIGLAGVAIYYQRKKVSTLLRYAYKICEAVIC